MDVRSESMHCVAYHDFQFGLAELGVPCLMRVSSYGCDRLFSGSKKNLQLRLDMLKPFHQGDRLALNSFLRGGHLALKLCLQGRRFSLQQNGDCLH